jgi:hypothetical protein
LRRLFAGLAAAATVSAAEAPEAFAEHTKTDRPTDGTAYTKQRGALRAGLWNLEASLFDEVTVGTATLPWLLLVWNAHVKAKVYDEDPLALSVGTGFWYMDLGRFEAISDKSVDARFFVAPLDLRGSYRFDDEWTLTVGGVWTGSWLTGTYDPASFQGTAATSNFQTVANVTVLLSDVVALNLEGRYLVVQKASARAKTTLYPDEFTTVEVQGTAATDAVDYPNAFSLVPSIHVSYGWFNLRAGLGYGNFNIPGVNFMLPDRSLVPELDIYGVFWP